MPVALEAFYFTDVSFEIRLLLPNAGMNKTRFCVDLLTFSRQEVTSLTSKGLDMQSELIDW